MADDNLLKILKIAAVASVALYYARKTQSESLSLGSSAPFVDKTGQMVDQLLKKSSLHPMVKLKLSQAARIAAHNVIKDQIKGLKNGG